jgi:opacity protein-like surface antigen
MLEQFFGRLPALAAETTPLRSARGGAILGPAVGSVLGALLLATPPAPAIAQSLGNGQCASTGEAGLIGDFNLAPFASGGAINSLVSAIDAANNAFLTQSSAFIGSPANPEPNQLGGGVWARAIGGQSNFNNTSTSTYSVDGEPVAGKITCNTRTQLNFAGVQVGSDVARLNLGGWNLHGGSTLGYMGAQANNYPSGGNFSDSLQIPFVGLYGAATKDGLFIDGQAKWSYYQNNLFDSQNGLFGQNLDGRGLSLTANVGYNYSLGDNWFVEPSAGVLWSKVWVDPLRVSGTFVLGQGFTPPGTVSINDIYNTLGRVSLRAGTSFNVEGVILQPFATISGFHDFIRRQSSTLMTSFNSIPILGPGFPEISGRLSTTGLGTYGQFGLGVVAQVPNTGWLAYYRGDYRTGEKIDGWSVNAGLRYQLNANQQGPERQALAAAPIAAAAYDWTGFYLGPSLGADWGYTKWTSVELGSKTYPRFAGVLAGGQLGYNYQYEKWVFGVEGALGWSNAHGSRACPNGFYFNCEAEVNFLSTVTGRVGFAYWDRVLWYGKGGLAIGRVKTQIRCNTDSQATLLLFTGGLLSPGCPAQSANNTAVGWTAGFGTELGLTDNLSVKAETSYFNLGAGRYAFAPFDTSVDAGRSGYIASIGLNYRFNGLGQSPAVIAKY